MQMLQCDEELLKTIEIVDAKPIDLDYVPLAHDAAYVQRFLSGQMTHSEMQKIGIPYSQALLDRVKVVTGGTCMAAFKALETNHATVNLAGGAHHAHYAHGAGYCVWNDIVIAGEAAIAKNLIKHFTVIDLDVHQGDGLYLYTILVLFYSYNCFLRNCVYLQNTARSRFYIFNAR